MVALMLLLLSPGLREEKEEGGGGGGGGVPLRAGPPHPLEDGRAGPGGVPGELRGGAGTLD